MAKMFFTLQETAEQLSVNEEQVKEYGSSGKLQIFKDRDRMMFKRDQVEELAKSLGGTGSEMAISLQGSGETEAVKSSDSHGPDEDANQASDAGEVSGIDVFEADEIEAADPGAQTQVAEPSDGDDELVLESVGSGSGLLDLTRESDDTSLGAELLDEILPGDSGADTKVASMPGGSEVGSALGTGAGAPGQDVAGGETPVGLPLSYGAEPYDPAGSGLSVGFLLIAMVCLVTALIVAVSAVYDVNSKLTGVLAKDTGSVFMYMGIGVVAALIFGIVGFLIGRSREGA